MLLEECLCQKKLYGEEGNGFWCVALFGNNVIWYNDIEEGFNVSQYHEHNLIDEYCCDQKSLNDVIRNLYDSLNK